MTTVAIMSGKVTKSHENGAENVVTEKGLLLTSRLSTLSSCIDFFTFLHVAAVTFKYDSHPLFSVVGVCTLIRRKI